MNDNPYVPPRSRPVVDLDASPFLRTIASVVLQPQRFTREVPPEGSVLRSLGFGFACVALCLIGVRALQAIAHARTWPAPGLPPAPVQAVVDLAWWALHYAPVLLAFPLTGWLIDWILLGRRVPSARLTHLWSLSMAHLVTVWLAVGSAWLGIAVFRPSPNWAGVLGLLLVATFLLWCLAAPVAWLYCRWRLLSWAAGDATPRARRWALAFPVLMVALAVTAGALG